MSSYIGLPPIPSDLKPLTSFLQRADEVKKQDPIISYWCAYYAAQVGISLKAPAPANRAFLSSLLTALENLRASVGVHDALDVESASCAYVENFALRVFAAADNEDRRGAATRATAKKFLAAATFLEVLKVFDDKTAWETHEEKVRYSKWKAAEIAKAIREGRKPTPGPANADAAPESDLLSPPHPSPPPVSPPTRRPYVSDDLEGRQDSGFYSPPHLPPQTLPSTSPTSPGLPTVAEDIAPRSAPVPITSKRHGRHGSASRSPPSPPSSAGSASSSRRSHRSRTKSLSGPHPPPPPPPTNFVAPSPGRIRTTSLSSASNVPIPPPLASPTHFVPRNSPPSDTPYFGSSGDPYLVSPPVESRPAPPPPPPAPISHIAPPPPPELTPGMIAKAQKHCRFAISALDYEDAEHARKELRAALAVLGG
ncbi:DUF605-domain-containing protein [Artomyces pyxidatus]|uniref:DUF605-domain-containing protein n=1 Tax=Artomyces pyxidatus TaxID=48021 RepID=A0ACB8TIA0_9AGAM|nr:DUF605-domain-containing protein [Artomyces pyxidatus]